LEINRKTNLWKESSNNHLYFYFITFFCSFLILKIVKGTGDIKIKLDKMERTGRANKDTNQKRERSIGRGG